MTTAGLETHAVQLSRTSTIFYWASYFSFSLAQCPTGPRQVVLQLNMKIHKLKLAQGKENLTADCLKGKLEFKFFQPFRGVDIFSHTLYPSPLSVFKLLILLHCPFLWTSEFREFVGTHTSSQHLPVDDCHDNNYSDHWFDR